MSATSVNDMADIFRIDSRSVFHFRKMLYHPCVNVHKIDKYTMECINKMEYWTVVRRINFVCIWIERDWDWATISEAHIYSNQMVFFIYNMYKYNKCPPSASSFCDDYKAATLCSFVLLNLNVSLVALNIILKSHSEVQFISYITAIFICASVFELILSSRVILWAEVSYIFR